MKSILAPILFATLPIASPLVAETLDAPAVGQSFVQSGGGFIPARVPSILTVGLRRGFIDPGVYRSAFEYDIRSIPNFSTIDKAELIINSIGGRTTLGGPAYLSPYLADGIIQPLDVVPLNADAVIFAQRDAGIFRFDITDLFRARYQIGYSFLGFAAQILDLGNCDDFVILNCGVSLFGVDDPFAATPSTRLVPNLVVTYRPFTPPPPPPEPVPEPASWALLIAGFGLLGTAARRRRRVLALA